MKRKTAKLTDAEKLKKIVDEIEDAFKQLKSDVDRHELDVFLDGTSIIGHKVEDDEDIEPIHVATLGAYTTVAELRKQIKKIATGKEDKPDTVGAIAISIDNEGKVQHQSFGNLPKEAREQLKQLFENEDFKRILGEDDAKE